MKYKYQQSLCIERFSEVMLQNASQRQQKNQFANISVVIMTIMERFGSESAERDKNVNYLL